MKKKIKIDEFPAKDEQGNEYTVEAWQNILSYSNAGKAKGLIGFFLSDGRELIRIDENTFDIEYTGIIISRC